MKVISNRVLVKMPAEGPSIINGIHIPESVTKYQFPKAEVIAVGPKVVDVKKGDTVIIDRYSGVGHRVEIKGVLHVVFQETDILAIA